MKNRQLYRLAACLIGAATLLLELQRKQEL